MIPPGGPSLVPRPPGGPLPDPAKIRHMTRTLPAAARGPSPAGSAMLGLVGGGGGGHRLLGALQAKQLDGGSGVTRP